MKRIKRNILINTIIAFTIFLLSILLSFSFSYMGVSDKQITKLILRNFKYFLLAYNLKILLFYLCIGLLIGVFGALLRIERRRGIILFAFFFWGCFWLRAVKLYPQLFLAQLYDRGGILKYFQVFVTDLIPLLFLYLFFVLVMLGIGSRKRRIPGALLVILVSFFLIARIKVFPTKAHQQTPPNVLIFATDSLRPQNISFHGYSRPTPNIDRFLAGGATFLNAKTSLARTFPLWTSILTSQFPPDHGIRTMYPSQKELQNKWLTLADVLAQRQYRTFVVSDFGGDMFSRHEYGFQQTKVPTFVVKSILKQRCLEIHIFLLGFLVNPVSQEIFPELSGLPMFLDPFFITESTKAYIRQSIRDHKPFFAISFSSNNHFPYVSRHPYYRLYREKKYNGKHKYCLGSDMLRSFLSEKIDPQDRQQIVNLYDGAARLFDDNLGEILSFLRKCGIDRNTIVIVMSDHGENLCDDSLGSGHGDHLRGPFAVNMLLGIRSPFENFHGRKISQTVRDIDLAPTILDMLGMPVPASFKGQSLLPCMRGRPFAGLPAYLETGIWYTRGTPFIPNRLRRDYPQIKEMLTWNMKTGEILIRDEFADVVINAKHRGLQLNERKYLYMPGIDGYQEEYYIDEKLQNPGHINDPDFLAFKEKIVNMFPDKFFLDERGFIREKGR